MTNALTGVSGSQLRACPCERDIGPIVVSLMYRSWAKPTEVVGARNQPRYRLSISPSSTPLQPSGSGKTYTGAGSGIVPVHGSADTVAVNREIWLLLSQHLVAKDRPLDDIALHVYEEHAHDGGSLEVGPLSSVSSCLSGVAGQSNTSAGNS